MFAAFLTTILFSFSAIFGRRLSHCVSGTRANLARLFLATALLGLWAHLFGFGIRGVAFPILFLSGCVGFGLGDLALFQAYPRLGARRTMVLVQCLAAPFGVIMEWLWLGQVPTLPQAAFGALILAGVGLALTPAGPQAQPAHGVVRGVTFGVLSAAGQAGGAVISRKAYAVAAAAGQGLAGVRDGLNVAYQRALGGLLITALLFVYLKITNKTQATRRADWAVAWPWVVGNALAGPVFGVTCYQWALMTTPTKIVLPIVATTPLAVIPLAHFFEGDRITRRAVLGGLAAVAGVVGLTLSR